MQHIVFEEVTQFSTEDAGAIRILVAQLNPDFQPLSDEDVQGIIASAQTHLLVARSGETGQIAGMITLVAYRIPYKMKGILEDFVVDSAFRKQGIGEQLLQFALAQARKYSVHSLILTSRPTREGANRLYQKMGFAKRDTNVYQVLL